MLNSNKQPNKNHYHDDNDDDNEEEEEEENPLVRCVNVFLKEAARGYAASIRVYAVNIMTSMDDDYIVINCQPIHDLIMKLYHLRMASPGLDPNHDNNVHNNSNSLKDDLTLLVKELSLIKW